ncbi:MAG: SpoIIE family protein phosphatase [Lachnospiraceae bacterium]|nr:SpoIIE family protein phosphatase [Lachnospiraceae bacterium]
MKEWRNVVKREWFLEGFGVVTGMAGLFEMNPVSVAYFFCLRDQGLRGIGAFIGTLLGVYLRMGEIEAVKYGVIILTGITLGHIFNYGLYRQNFYRSAIRLSVVTFVLTISEKCLSGLMGIHIWMAVLEGILVLLFMIVLRPGLAFLLCGSLRRKNGEIINNEEMVSLIVIYGIIMYVISYGDSGIALGAGRLVAWCGVLIIGYLYGSGAGAAMGAVCGGASLLGGMSASVIKGSLAGQMSTFWWMHAGDRISLMGVWCMAGIFAGALPGKYKLQLVRGNQNEESESYVRNNVQKMTKSRFYEYADALQRLSRLFRIERGSAKSFSYQDINEVFEDVSAQFCKDCPHSASCWDENYEASYSETQKIFLKAREQGVVRREEVPVSFFERCYRADEFLSETNHNMEISRINQGWYGRLMESREAVAEQLNEIASMIRDFSVDVSEIKQVHSKREGEVKRLLQRIGVELRDIYLLERKGKITEYHVMMKVKAGYCVTVREVADCLERIFGQPIRAKEGSRKIVPKTFETVVFEEDAKFKILTGIARCKKSGEGVSGDSYSFLELQNGDVSMVLADGMGSGDLANKESTTIIDMLERFMEAGCLEESAIKMINSMYLLQKEGKSYSTIDVSLINRYTGRLQVIKMGAPATFIRRKDGVEILNRDSFPAGIFSKVEAEELSKILQEGEQVIMMTDGVLDNVGLLDKEKVMADYIQGLTTNNAQRIAEEILDFSLGQKGGENLDDMTVMVAGIWEKNASYK